MATLYGLFGIVLVVVDVDGIDWFKPVFELLMVGGFVLFVFGVAFLVDRLLPERKSDRRMR